MTGIRRHVASYCLLFIILACCLYLIWGCDNHRDPNSSDSSQSGDIRFELNWHQASINTNVEPAAIDCGAVNVDTSVLSRRGVGFLLVWAP